MRRTGNVKAYSLNLCITIGVRSSASLSRNVSPVQAARPKM
uniref:Uncharacterized protein n=1 Tax=Rhizophora mucronata TaxID=61149 RepID=A0A2P2IYZ0_RHIMU